MRSVIALAVVASVTLGACARDDDGDDTSADAPTTGPETSTSVPAFDPVSGAVTGAHDCIVGDPGAVSVAWEELRNPVLALDHMTKDQTVRVVDGRWYVYFSERVETGDADRVAAVASDDLRAWEPIEALAGETWDSPDLTRDASGRFVLSQQLPDPADPESRKIFVRTADAVDGPWSEPVRLVPDLFTGERLIDAALAHTRGGLFVMFKRGARESVEQFTEVARSPSGALEGPWEPVGRADFGWAENYQFLVIDGAWHVLVTAIPVHVPTLYRLGGDPAVPEHWLRWEKVGELVVPEEDWNRGEVDGIDHETANSAYLCDARAADGYWYLFYAGSTELTTFDGRGHAKIGVARSRDLVDWQPPGQRLG